MRMLFLLLAGSLCLAGSAGASIVVLEDARYITADGHPPTFPAPGASLFDAQDVGAGSFSVQNSTLGSSGFSGNGGYYTDGPVPPSLPYGWAASVFDVAFTVDAPTTFQLSTSVTAPIFPSAPVDGGVFGDSNGIFHVIPVGQSSLTGTLLPGTQYRLIVLVASSYELVYAGNSPTWFLTLTVPEPSLALLALVAGLTLLPARRL